MLSTDSRGPTVGPGWGSHSERMILIVPFSRKYDRALFDCGAPSLNDWLRLQAGQQERKGNTRTFLAVDSDSNKILGYYASLASEASPNTLCVLENPQTRSYLRPAIRIARLAVATDSQGRGTGSLLFRHALEGVVGVAERIGIEVILVDAIDVAAKGFYSRFGFAPFSDSPLLLMVTVTEIRRLVVGL